VKPSSRPQIPAQFDSAIEAAKRGGFGDALERIEGALEKAPSHEALATAAALALAEVARRAGRARNAGSAEEALRRAISLRPRFADLRFQLACLLLGQNRSREAREQLEAALDANARYVAARVELALLDAREGFVPEALTALQDLTASVAVKDLPALKLGMRSLERADWEEAASLIRRGFRLSDPELMDRIERFHALMKQENFQGALDLLREVLPRHDAYPDLHYLTGIAELQLGALDDALSSFARALELHPDFHAARVQFAGTLEAMGLTAVAQEEIAFVLQREPTNREAKAFLEAHPRVTHRAA